MLLETICLVTKRTHDRVELRSDDQLVNFRNADAANEVSQAVRECDMTTTQLPYMHTGIRYTLMYPCTEFTNYYKSVFQPNTPNADEHYKTETLNLLRQNPVEPVPQLVDLQTIQNCVKNL